MNYPIVQIKTSDGVWLYGLFLEASHPKALYLNIHGTASNFYEEYFIEVMTQSFLKDSISMLSVNNRGAGVYDAWQGSGAATEIFADCVLDIDAWIQFAFKKGYNQIILSGHSLGTEKVVYYMNHGKYVEKVKLLVLLAPADSYGSHRLHEGKPNVKVSVNIQKRLEEDIDFVKNGKGDTFMPRDTYGSHGGIMPKTADSLLDSLGSDSKLLQALPITTSKLEAYSMIKIPILVAIGDQNEYTGLTIKDSIELMKKENSLTEVVQFQNCDHDFQECEEELSETILKFIRKHFSSNFD